ncbi:hypothetical protein SBBP1_260028 [Burkholderiales bacterium]|nr:hypothetical protein SBBP1_260028 [Burkholderiales bacterium]
MHDKPPSRHLPMEGRPVAAVRVDDPHLRGWRCVARDKSGQSPACVTFVQQIAAHDQVILPCDGEGPGNIFPDWLRAGSTPVCVPILHRWQIVQSQVLPQKAFRQGMAIACGDIGASPMADKARQGEAATDLEDPFTRAHRTKRDTRCQEQTGRPQLTEQRPRGRGDAQAIRLPKRVVELLAVQQRADDQIIDTGNRNVLLFGLVAQHRLVRATRCKGWQARISRLV